MTALEKRLIQENEELLQRLETALQEIAMLKVQVAELSEKLNQNSRNSSKPPSSDGYEKPTPQSLRKCSGKKPGGQKGHPGKNLTIDREPDERIRHMPSCCEGCANAARCAEHAQLAETRYVVDAVVRVNIAAHEALTVECPLSGESGMV